MRDCEDEDSFEPFIFAFIAFNAWAACITGVDQDREWLDALMLCDEISETFADLLASKESPLLAAGNSFMELWPIFKAQQLRRRDLFYHSESAEDRPQVVSAYLAARPRIDHQPSCLEQHKERGEPIPLDWPHTISVIYRVRCNLFHGEKSTHSEMDKLIVTRAFRVLVHFLAESGFMGR